MNKIENDILESVELQGLTQDQISEMSNYEIKEFQRGQSDDKINTEKKRVEFRFVSMIFFLIIAGALYVNPIFTVYASIAPAVATLAFAFMANYSHENLKTEKQSRRMLEMFYEENEL